MFILHFTVIVSKISDKTDKFLLNTSFLLWWPMFIRTQCSIVSANLVQILKMLLKLHNHV